MKSLSKIQKSFQTLNTEMIEEYEHKVKQFKAEEKLRYKEIEEKNKRKRKILDDAGYNTTLIDKLEKEDSEAFLKTLSSRREALINRKSVLATELQSRHFYTEILNDESRKTMQPFGACLMASDQKLLDNIEGVRGNPWILPYDPSKIDIKDSGSIDIWCWQAYGGPPPTTANIWFNFVPNSTGLWNLSAIIAFHGFYILRSDDSWYNCRRAWVKLTAKMWVHQYAWQPVKKFTLLDKSETNANYTKLFDSTEWLDTTAVLKAGDLAWILVTFEVEGFGEGSGTYGELNFKDGSANYVLPVLATASPA